MKKQQILPTNSTDANSSSRIPREKRYFSEDARKQVVSEIEKGVHTVSEASRVYQVSAKSIYKWLEKYSVHYQKSIIQVVELESEYHKRKALEEELKTYKMLLGSKQVEIEYLKAMIDAAEEEYRIDIKKNSDSLRSSSIIKTAKGLKIKE